MDKESFLHQLESAVTNNDKKLFIDAIFNLPADVIVGFTKEEFLLVIDSSNKINLQSIDEFLSFLEFEGTLSLNNTLQGVDEYNNCILSKFYYSLYISISKSKKEKVKNVIINYAAVHGKLAEMNIDCKENLENVIRICSDSRKIFSVASEDYASALIIESNARQAYAEMNIAYKENFEIAINLYIDSRKIFSTTSRDYSLALMNEGNARSRLAEKGFDSKKNLDTAVSLYVRSRKIFPKKSVDYACSLVNEGNARLELAKLGFDSRKNLENAITIYIDSRELFSKKSRDYARSLMNEGIAWLRLAELGIASSENLERSKKLLLESISILEELGDGWIYSLALLNLNDMLKDNFYKTGNWEYLKEWENNLGDIEEKINNREMMYKGILRVRIHEIRASLLELDGKSGLYKASREYDKAYEILKIPYYKFMNEFCQARINTISFCELVSNWKEIKKESIFLDYYDYTIFECHLENALNSTINEEEELKLAVEKLKEIRDRTQIKIIKDRVSAYIHLLQALIDCFTKDSYIEAAKNVREGCKIFREYGDKQGQHMCEIFHNAVVKREKPDAWQDIIRNREFSSNFYSLLCEYSDRKRANFEFYKYEQINEKVKTVFDEIKQVKDISIRTENKIDEIQNQIHSGFAEINVQIEEGFDGTAAELRQIKGKIDNIQRDLDNLVRISNDVDGKEGECIREFALQMLELIKKGDCRALKRFIERVVQNSSSIAETIEASEIPEEKKEEAKSKLSSLNNVLSNLKNKSKSFSVDVAKDVLVSLTAEEVIKVLTPILSTAAFGVPIPSQIVAMLFEATRDL